MDKVTDRLNVIIQEASLDGTLSKRAIDLFHGILEENEELKTQFETDREKIKADALMIDSLKTDLNVSRALNKVAAEAEMAMIEREQKMTRLELTAEHHEQRVVDHQFMFTQVFRNIEVRRTVFPVSPSQHISDSGMTAPGGFVEERTQKETAE